MASDLSVNKVFDFPAGSARYLTSRTFLQAGQPVRFGQNNVNGETMLNNNGEPYTLGCFFS